MYYKRLREIREDADHTQRYLAALLGMKQPQYARYENGNRDKPVHVLKRFCLIYGVSADYIMELPNNLVFPR